MFASCLQPQTAFHNIYTEMDSTDEFPKRTTSLKDLKDATGITFFERIHLKKDDANKVSISCRWNKDDNMEAATVVCNDVVLQNGRSVEESLNHFSNRIELLEKDDNNNHLEAKEREERYEKDMEVMKATITNQQIALEKFTAQILETMGKNLTHATDNANFVLEKFKEYDATIASMKQEWSQEMCSLKERVTNLENQFKDSTLANNTLFEMTKNAHNSHADKIGGFENDVSIVRDLINTLEKQLASDIQDVNARTNEVNATVQKTADSLSFTQDKMNSYSVMFEELSELRKLLVKVEEKVYNNTVAVEDQSKTMEELMNKLSEGVIALD